MSQLGPNGFHLLPQTSFTKEWQNPGGTMMPAERWKPSSKQDAEIERLLLELASFNKRINELEKLHPEGWKIEALKTSALVLSRQIDELRYSADDLTSLLAKWICSIHSDKVGGAGTSKTYGHRFWIVSLACDASMFQLASLESDDLRRAIADLAQALATLTGHHDAAATSRKSWNIAAYFLAHLLDLQRRDARLGWVF
jgi:hypothetical protein